MNKVCKLDCNYGNYNKNKLVDFPKVVCTVLELLLLNE